MSKMDISALTPQQKRALLAKMLNERAAEQTRTFPLSHAQQRLWFMDCLKPGTSVYSIPLSLRLGGPLDQHRLRQCIEIIVARHESLRTRFAVRDGEPVQTIVPALTIDLACEALPNSPSALEGRLQALVEAPFDLQRGPLFRCRLFAVAPGEHVLALVLHHIIADYSSLQVLLREFLLLYGAAGSPRPDLLPPLPIQYADYAAWQRQQDGALEAQLDYWRGQLADAPLLLQLPTDFRRPAIQSFDGARHVFHLDRDLSARIEGLARARGMTPFMVLLAAFQLLLRRYSGSDDICVGSTVSNRERDETRHLIGLFVNNLVLRARFEAADTFDTILARIRGTVLDAFTNGEVPFEQVVRALDVEPDLSRNALFQVAFVLHNSKRTRVPVTGLDVEPVAFAPRTSRFDLSLDMYEGEGFSGVLEYSTDLFRPGTIARLAGHFATLLKAVVSSPSGPVSHIDLLSPAEHEALAARNRTTAPLPETDLASLIETTAASRGHAEAIRCADRTLSYTALNTAANRLSDALRKAIGAHPPDAAKPCIAICLPRSEKIVVAILAVLKLGWTYIPLDPSHPPERLQQILEDGGAALMVVRDAAATIPALADAPPCPMFDIGKMGDLPLCEDNPERQVAPDDLAYVIFTSGSTGRPKGVPIRQDSLINLLTSMAREPGMGTADTLVAVTTPSFDIATLELLMPLLVGGRLVVADAHTVYDDIELMRLLAESGATMMQATPATWRLLADAGWRAPPGFKMLCGGEALDPALAHRLLAGHGTLWNLYGPTETTIWSACTLIRPEQASGFALPIGEPIANTQLYVLDHNLMPVPAGVSGELYIGGAGLSPGYLGRDDLTAAAFVPSPFHADDPANPSPRLYRTGDAVRRLEDGSLIYLGRLDFQVKLRGYRIELAEIEAALDAEPAVEQSVVMLWPEENGDGELVAYCRFACGQDAVPDTDLRDALARRLPSYMIPSAFVAMERFPLNANGKVDRKRLPRAAVKAAIASYMPPSGETEIRVAEIWSAVLGVERVGREDHFFHLGGHSLLAARTIARLRQVFFPPPALRTLFEKPRLRDFAAAVAQDAAPTRDAGLAIPRQPRGGPLLPSYAQQRQWALAQLEPDSASYNIPTAIRLKGQLDPQRLQQAIEIIFDRHEVLRSRFISHGGMAMVEIEPHIHFPLPVHEISADGLEEVLLEEIRRPFDLAAAPLLRVCLCRTDAHAHVILITIHHIVADALSVDVLVREVMQVYRDLGAKQPISLPPLAVQYADFAAWQRARDTSGQLEYWRKTLAGAPPLLELPTDFPRPAMQSFDGEVVRFTIDARLTVALRTECGRTNATLFMGMLAAFSGLLSRYSGMNDIVVGTPLAQRPHADLEGLVGMFVNTLALRLRCTGVDSFHDLLERARHATLEAFAHQDVPFEQVVDALSVPRSWSHNPVFQAMLVWRTAERQAPIHLDGVEWEPLSLPHRASRVDLTLFVRETDDDLRCALEYRSDLFRHETILAMTEAFTTLLEGAVAQPEARIATLAIVPPSQRRLLQAWNATKKAYSPGPECLQHFFEAQAAATPAAPAVADGRQSITYGELDKRVSRVAAELTAMGVGRGSRIGIGMPRRIDLVTALLAVLKTGATYVPLDPRYPKDRIDFIAADAGLMFILTLDGALSSNIPIVDFAELLAAAERHEATGTTAPHGGRGATGEDLAYLIYTSGSTGRPKGVAIAHRNAVAFVNWSLDAFSREQLAGVLASTSVCFDLSIFEIFTTLAAGGQVLLVDDVFALPEAPFANDVTLVNTVPTPMSELLRLGPLPARVATVCLAGEPLPPELADRILAAGSVKVLHNLYGPSEDTTYSTDAVITAPGATFGIGYPIANTKAHVLDAEMMEVLPGVPGELYLAGAGVANGYWNRPDLTAERFLPNPFAQSGEELVMYRTGDRVRRLHDGALDYLGRCDRQMKVHGFRIEPGEVEAALLRQPGVSSAIVDVWCDAGGNRRLAAWLAGDPAPDGASIVAALRHELPDHLVPTLAVGLTRLPRLPNGKLDRSALPDPTASVPSRPVGEALEGTEKRLGAIWSALLGRKDISRDDNFFTRGGDSILAIQVVAEARRAGMSIVPRDIFQHPTLALLADAVGSRTPSPADRDAIGGAVPLTPIQRWLLERELPHVAHWNQGLILATTRPLDADRLEASLSWLAARHDVLRARFTKDQDGWRQEYRPKGEKVPFRRLDLDTREALTDAAMALHAGFNLTDGPLWGAFLATLRDGGQRLVLAAHHLLVDGVSWRILISDLQACYAALEADLPPPPELRSSSVAEWVEHLAQSTLFDADAAGWDAICQALVPPLPLDYRDGANLMSVAAVNRQVIDESTAQRLLKEVPAAFAVTVEDVLVAALYLTIREWTSSPSMRIELESHGRPDLFEDIDLSATVGWLTALYPVLLESDARAEAGEVLLAVKETLRRIPHGGVGYGVLRHLRAHPLAGPDIPAQLRFNYLGQIDAMLGAQSLFSPATESAGPMLGAANPRDIVLEINAMASGGRLHLLWNYSTGLHRAETITGLMERFAIHLSALVDHCLTTEEAGFTPADFPHMDLKQAELDDLLRSL